MQALTLFKVILIVKIINRLKKRCGFKKKKKSCPKQIIGIMKTKKEKKII